MSAGTGVDECSTLFHLTNTKFPYMTMMRPVWHDDPHNKYLRMAVIRTADDKYEVVVSETYKRVFHSLSEMPEYLAVQLALVMAASAEYGQLISAEKWHSMETLASAVLHPLDSAPDFTFNNIGWVAFKGAYCVVVPVAVLEELRGEGGDTRSKSKSKGKEDSSRA